MENIIIGAVIAALALGAIVYIWREKKKGRKCIGCPHSSACSGKCGENKE